MRSLGLASHLLALEDLSIVERRARRIVLRMPHEPDYWWGNVLVVLDSPGDPDAEIELFRKEFPNAGHAVIAWDWPGLDPETLRPAWEAKGFELEVSDVLARSGPPATLAAPDDYVLRELGSEGDWEQAFRLGMEIGEEEGHDPADHAPFLRRRIAGRRRQAAQGSLRWWGAFRDGELAAAMGVVTGRIDGSPMARYQAVETARAHRRRGLCSALLGLAARGALEREPGARLVIVADTDGAPGRLYRRAGFEPVERTVAVVRRPLATP